MGWTRVIIPSLKATGTTTVLTFGTISSDGPYGIVPDDIPVVDQAGPVPAPGFPSLAVPVGCIIGMIGVILVVRKPEGH